MAYIGIGRKCFQTEVKAKQVKIGSTVTDDGYLIIQTELVA